MYSEEERCKIRIWRALRVKSKLSVLKAYDAISCEEEPQIISVDTFLSRSGMYSLFLKSGLHMVTSFQRVQHEEGERE